MTEWLQERSTRVRGGSARGEVWNSPDNENTLQDKGGLCNGISRTNITMKQKDREKAVRNEEKARTKHIVKKTHGKLGGLAKAKDGVGASRTDC